MQFGTDSLGDRQKDWKDNLYFTCTCIACKEEWPELTPEAKKYVIWTAFK